MFSVKVTDAKITPAKKTIALKNISAADLRLVDTDTGEDITADVLAALPDDVETLDFKLIFEV